ncbi:YkvA family protein [Halomonas saccharevitans]|uniref:Uncharacterized membrane protein YkvA, DUF1232 family n=1 Tax=Halomonas saccharevitans TaxID=416872 RepID=A0A1I7CIV4_9GAMM|nr:YkvA family protein [Halomonas saccharevitans]SFT99319.1 Uncharacterized membrane protein YkvA, DUF1232 family [Halomonas saccharevitans]
MINFRYQGYGKHFSNRACWKKVKSLPGTYRDLIYYAKLLWYVMQDPSVPVALKTAAIGALGYLISPVDLMPDMLPGGFVDDLAVVMSVLKMLDAYVTPEIRRRARE